MASTRSGRTSWGPTLAIIAGLGLVAAALLVLPGLLAPNEMAAPSPAAPSASLAPSRGASPYRSISWTIVPFSDPALELDRLIAHDGRLIATGHGADGVSLWYSDTGGHQWIQAAVGGREPPREGAQSEVTALSGGGPGLLATGEWRGRDGSGLGALVMLSADGRHWENLPVQPELAASRILALLGADDGYLAYAVDRLTNIASWWQSADGVSWTTAPVTGLPARDPPLAFAAAEDEVVAVGRQPASGEGRPGAWISEHGFTWESTLDEPGMFGYVESVAQHDVGYAAGGSSWGSGGIPEQGIARLWLSRDGRAWTSLAVGQEAGTSLGSVALNEAGAVGVLYSHIGADVRATFVPLGTDLVSTVGLPLRGVATVVLDDGFVMLGRCPVGADCPAASYLLLGSPTEDAQAPAPTIPPG